MSVSIDRVHRGIHAITKQFERWDEAYPDLKLEPLEAKEKGDQVSLWVRFIAHGASSGAPMEMQMAHVLTLGGGRVSRVVEHMERDEAFKAVRLE